MSISFAGAELKNYLVASSSPLTESQTRLQCCRDAGFGAAILKSAAPYVRTGAGYGRKVVYVGEDYYADASFEREIMTLEEGVTLYNSARGLNGDMLLIPSVTAASLDPEVWYPACKAFEDAGALLLQLDFFYLGTMSHDDAFYFDLSALLDILTQKLTCVVMPKLNLGFDPERTCKLLAGHGVRYVSLLDSMREDLPPEYGLHAGTTSYFGGRQLPQTLRYLKAAVRQGLHICAGGGVAVPEDVSLLLSNGAELVQSASYALKNGFSSVYRLLPGQAAPETSPGLRHNPWCDVEDGAPCEDCGACRRQSPPAEFSHPQSNTQPSQPK